MFNRKLKRQVSELQSTIEKQQELIKYGAGALAVTTTISLVTSIATMRLYKAMDVNSVYVAKKLTELQDEIREEDEEPV